MSELLFKEMSQPFAKEVWDTLSKIDCSEHVEKKMNLSYLSWAWAWATLMDRYPCSYYRFDPPTMLPDKTCEIWVTVGVSNGIHVQERQMWLPVMDHRNNAIVGPDSRQINDTRMRCLVKCLAMFGLGHYIYAGEDLPKQLSDEEIKAQEQAKRQAILDDAFKRNYESIVFIKECIEEGRHDEVVEAWMEIEEEDKKALWVAPTKYKNAPFTTKERDYFKGEDYAAARTARYSGGTQS